MIFTQPAFLVFFLVVFTTYRLLSSNTWRKRLLLLASYFFYGYWDYRFLALILVSTLIDYVVGKQLVKTESTRRRKWLVTASVVSNLGILGFFKYFNFFLDTAYQLLEMGGVSVEPSSLDIILPVGISFFTFQSMSYTIDVYRKELEPRNDFVDFAMYVSFFPQLVAGPIVRARDFLPQLDRKRTNNDVDLRRVLVLFLLGFFKKTCVADNIAAAIDPLFADPTGFDPASRLLGAILYSVQIYCDFSGYTDMAIAVAGVFGYQLVKNFDVPYFSRSVREFWQRWHISLSTWLRDYLYIPLGGNRGGQLAVARNLMLTMLLGGLWHGANWTFILWGFLHGLALGVHRMFTRARRRFRPDAAAGGSLLGNVVAWLLTISWVVMCFTIFRAPNIASAADFLRGSKAEVEHIWAGFWLLLVALALVHYVLWRQRERAVAGVRGVSDGVFYPALGCAAAVVLYFAPLNLSPFIYFQF